MISFLLKKGAIPFTEKEDRFAKEMLRIFRDHCQREGAFLHQVQIDRFQLLWSPYMASHQEGMFGGIMGCWDPGTRWKVFLIPLQNTGTGEYPADWAIGDNQAINSGSYLLMDAIATTMIHEIYHAWQFSVNPVLWIINRSVTLFLEYIPFLKKLTLEDDVDKHISDNEEVNEFFSDLTSAWDTLLFLKRCEKSLQRNKSENQDEETISDKEQQVEYARGEFLKHPEWRRKAVISLFTIMA